MTRDEVERAIWRQYPMSSPVQVDRVLEAIDAHIAGTVDARVQAELERLRQLRRSAYQAATRGALLQPCGTPAAAERHRRHGDIPAGKKLRDVCPQCADAEAEEYRDRMAAATAERTGRTQ